MAKLSKKNWVEAGMISLAEKGIDGVKVETLSKQLGVSKGSFYWHFKNRDALIEAMLDDWQERATHAIINIVDDISEDPMERLVVLSNIIFRPTRFDGTEANWRIAGIKDSRVAAACKGIDATRIAYVRDLLVSIGVPLSQSKHRSHLLYMVLIGNTTWVQTGGRKMSKKEVNEIVSMLTSLDG